MLRKYLTGAAVPVVAALMVVVSPIPAHAATGEVDVFVFTAGANVSQPIFVPVAFDPPPTGVTWSFDTEVNGLEVGGVPLRACVGDRVNPLGTPVFATGVRVWVNNALIANVGAPAPSGPRPEACRLRANGNLNPGLGGLGPFCGWSSGTGTVTTATVDFNGVAAEGASVVWLQSVGTVLPLVISGGPTNVAGAGVVQTTGARPGTCGVGGGTTTFAVTGAATTVAR